MELFGRRKIYSDVESVNYGNVVKVIRNAAMSHEVNRAEIEYLYNYYRGKQPILYRTKDIRPEICNRIVENRAYEIVSFKVGYLCGEPIQYISRNTNASVSRNVSKLNDMMLSIGKANKDRQLVEWQMICGTAHRMVSVEKNGESPFDLHTLDPRNAFVIYSSRLGEKPLAGVYFVTDDRGDRTFFVYTDKEYFEVEADKVLRSESHALGMIPLIEYPANNSRLGAFEIVISVLDNINQMESNRADGVEQFVQSLMKFINCDIDEESFAALQQMGAIKIKSGDGQNADVEIMTQELDQSQTQVLVDHAYQTALDICGMPNRNGGGSSTSDTGAASLLRDGWTLAEARAKDSETIFKQSETEMLKVILPLCESLADVSLSLSDIDTKFTRRNYENIQTKAQVLCEMLNNEKIDPILAFAHCGMFTDSEEAYRVSMAWYEKKQKEMNETLREAVKRGGAESVPSDGQSDRTAN